MKVTGADTACATSGAPDPRARCAVWNNFTLSSTRHLTRSQTETNDREDILIYFLYRVAAHLTDKTHYYV